jgi:hypothetical protein
MTKKTFSAQHIRPRLAKVLLEHGIDNLQLEIDLAAAVRPLCVVDPGVVEFDYDEERAKNGNKDIQRLLKVRDSIQSTLRKNIYDWERGEWAGFDRWLAKRPENETIERFITWWNSDDFRRKQGTVYLNARKIKENWLQVFSNETVINAEPMKGGGYR